MQLIVRSTLFLACSAALFLCTALFAFAQQSFLTVTPQNGAAPQTVQFGGQYVGEGYSIDFGDGSTSGDIGCGHGSCPGADSSVKTIDIEHTYTKEGNYVAKLRSHYSITDANCAGEDCNVVDSIQVNVGNPSQFAAEDIVS
ncbi:MAG: hypothetical protein WDZ93_03130, partial [Candidatus Paceibacterota bacterium]